MEMRKYQEAWGSAKLKHVLEIENYCHISSHVIKFIIIETA